jgi:polysaccharide pyruvyl transferase WcaK-like protein
MFPMDLYRACTSHHAAILCEGSTLKSTFANGLTLFLSEAAGIMGAQHKPCIAYGSEVGQMDPFLKRAAARLCRNTYFITRTQGSLTALRKLGLKGHAGTDAAWSYEGAICPEEADRILRKKGWDGSKPLLGIAVIDPFCWPVRASLRKWFKGHLTRNLSGQYDHWYFYTDSPERRAAFRRYIDGVAGGINAFLQRTDCFPVLIGMERLDAKACSLLEGKLDRPGAVFLSGDNDASVMTGVLQKLSYLVTSRYHASVLSMEGGCPIVAISMDERLDGIMQELGFDQEYLFHTGDSDLGQKLCRALEAANRNRTQIKEHIRHQLIHYKKILEEMGSYLKDYMDTGLSQEENRG